jgi:hypothetical protein
LDNISSDYKGQKKSSKGVPTKSTKIETGKPSRQ